MPNIDAQLSKELLSQAIKQLPCGVVFSNNADKIIWCNDIVAELTQCSSTQLLEMTVAQLEQEYLPLTPESENLIALSSGAEQVHKWLKKQNIPIQTGDNVRMSIYWDVTQEQMAAQEVQRLNEQLEQLNTVDPVSGLFNRRAMLQNIEPLVSRSRRYENPLSVIAMELMNLTTLAQEHGQNAADQAVTQLAQLLRDQIRWADFVSRPDDSHIVFILPETDRQAAIHLAFKIKNQVAEMDVQFDKTHKLKIDACYGVASWEKGFDALLLLRNANQALADALANGPGTVFPTLEVMV